MVTHWLPQLDVLSKIFVILSAASAIGFGAWKARQNQVRERAAREAKADARNERVVVKLASIDEKITYVSQQSDKAAVKAEEAKRIAARLRGDHKELSQKVAQAGRAFEHHINNHHRR